MMFKGNNSDGALPWLNSGEVMDDVARLMFWFVVLFSKCITKGSMRYEAIPSAWTKVNEFNSQRLPNKKETILVYVLYPIPLVKTISCLKLFLYLIGQWRI
ncbi:hypothetical protein Hanom_Chr03g00208601 [Helianthus anomalus]